MRHIDDGTLRAYHDDELSPDAQARVLQHLNVCTDCTEKAQSLSARALWLAERLAVGHAEVVPPVQEARRRLTTHPTPHPPSMPILEENSMNTRPFWRRLPTPAVVAVAVTLLITLALIINPLRTFAADYLQLFRVERVTVIPVEFQEIDSTRFEGAAEWAHLIAAGVEVEQFGEPQEVDDAAAASAIVGQPVRLPAGAAVDSLHVESGVTMRGTLNEAQLEAVFQMLEQPIDLPSSVDGQPFEVTVPQIVRATVGEGCESFQRRPADDCAALVQLASPMVEFPDELPVAQLGEIFLQLLGYETAAAQELARSIDWTSTLVVPVPSRALESQSVSVDGVEGTLLLPRADTDHSQEYALVWVRDGILYGLTGTGDPAQALELANSLR